MTVPKRAVSSSGVDGRGYRPFGHKVKVQPSVTTVLKAEAKDALAQWAADQTAAFAVANADQLFRMSDMKAWGFLRWKWNKEPKDPLSGDVDLASYHHGVLKDSGELGDSVHEWIEADLFGLPFPDVSNRNAAFWECVEQWNIFKSQHKIVPHRVEITVWDGDEELGYGGTFDLLIEVDGKLYLVDIKTSRGLYSSTWMQLAALYNAPYLLEDDPTVADPKDGEDRLLSGWTKPIEGLAVIHVRPTDDKGPAFAKWVPMPTLPGQTWQEAAASFFRAFKGLRQYVEVIKREMKSVL